MVVAAALIVFELVDALALDALLGRTLTGVDVCRPRLDVNSSYGVCGSIELIEDGIRSISELPVIFNC